MRSGMSCVKVREPDELGTVVDMPVTSDVVVVLDHELNVIPLKCTALAKWKVRGNADGTYTGDPHCGRWAVPGLDVCKKHGGGTPRSQEAAVRRVEQAVERARLQLSKKLPRAIEVVEELMEPAWDRDEAVRLRAATTIMDRTGLAKVTKTEVTGTIDHHVSQVDQDIERLLGGDGTVWELEAEEE